MELFDMNGAEGSFRNPIPVGYLITHEGPYAPYTDDVYECKKCGSLVRDWENHIEWHQSIDEGVASQ